MSTPMSCLNDSQSIEYCLIDGDWYVGNNETNAYSNLSTPADIIIPQLIDGHPIHYIGKRSFNFNRKLRSVKILARIEAIHFGAFANCNELEYINIPSTLTYLYDSSIQCFNHGKPSLGLLTVAFEIDSHIQYIGRQLFSYKQYTHIYICQNMNPIYGEYLFHDTIATVYSTSSFLFGNIQTTLTYCCSPKVKCTHRYLINSRNYVVKNTLSIFILLK